MKYFTFIPLLFFSSFLLSQETVKITYEVEQKGKKITARTTTGVLPPETKRAIAKTNKKLFEWFVNSRYALYREKKQETAIKGFSTITSSSYNLSIGSPMRKNKSFSYDQFDTSLWDYKEKTRIGIAKIFNKNFRVDLSAKELIKVVKVTNEKKKILGYSARKVIVERDNDMKETYWFTDELKAISPYRLKGIEGVVLQIDLPHKSIKAVQIDKEAMNNSVFKDFIEEYKEVKVINKDQYADLLKEEQDEKMSSVKNLLKGSNINLDSIIKDARKRAEKKIKKNN